MSDTPRTDAFVDGLSADMQTPLAEVLLPFESLAEFARQLERSLAESQEARKYWADLYQREGQEVLRLKRALSEAEKGKS